MTVSRSVDNGLYVAIAPNNESTGHAALVGQTYDVEVLLLVPRWYFGRVDMAQNTSEVARPAEVTLVSYTELRDVRNGAILDDRSHDEYRANVIHLLSPFLRDFDLGLLKNMRYQDMYDLINPLRGGVVGGNWADARSSVHNLLCDSSKGSQIRKNLDANPRGKFILCLDRSLTASLWPVISALNLDSPFKAANFEAPLPHKISIPPQNVLVTGDTGDTVTVILGAVEGASAGTLAARLDLTPKVGPAVKSDPVTDASPACPTPSQPKCVTAPPMRVVKPGKPPAPTATNTASAIAVATAGPKVSLVARAATLDPVAHTLTLTFPSPAKAGVSALWDQDSPNSVPSSSLIVTQVGCEDVATLCPAFTPVTLPVKLGTAPSATAVNGFTLMDDGNTMLVDDAGIVSIPLTINSVSPGITVTLSVNGAAVSSLQVPGTTPVVILAGTQGYPLPAAGTYVLNLSNVTPGKTITVTAASTKPDPAGGSNTVKVGTVTQTFVAVSKPHTITVGN